MTLQRPNPDPTMSHALPTAGELLHNAEGALRLRRNPGLPNNEQLYAYRLVAILKTVEGEESYLTKGDASIHCEREVEKGAIIGKVFAIERGGQRLEINGKFWQAFNLRLVRWMWAWARANQRQAPQHPLEGRMLSFAGTALFSTLLRVMVYVSKAIGHFSRLVHQVGDQG